MSLRAKALNGVVWSLSDKLINQLGYLAVTIFIARIIGPESFGLIGMLTIFTLLAESVVNNGFAQALIQRSQYLTEEDSSTIFYVNIFWGIVMYFLLYFCAPFISAFYNAPELVEISRVLFLVILVSSLTVVVRAKLTINIDFKSQAIANTISTLLSACIGIYLAMAGYGYWSLVWLLITKSIFNGIVLWFYCQWLPKFIFSAESFNRLFKFGSNLMLAGFVATFVNNLYVALVGRYFNATQVGYFTQATNLSNYATQFINSTLQGVTYPIMTSIKDDRERLVNVYTQLISITMLVSVPLLIGFAAVSNEFVRLLLGEDWLPVIPVLIALCFARSITPISSINLNILNAIGRSDLFLKVDLSKLPMTVAALFIALPYGIEGLAWAMVCTSFIAFFINSYYPGKLFGFGGIAQLKIAYKYIIAAALMYFAIGLISANDSLLLTLLVKIALGAIIYIAMLFVLRDKFFLNSFGMIYSKIKN
ncbi:lipopolysaccharide biosynthesis protein [Marinomonas sp. M1K-6]|uniref:Lipopolysaccharide biosynthesis protein n=1 Tax=Marinomonas profundi TaxID=2726122 RepID=A0A847RFD9_9GAMM|nr:lipopolysaccharide biosynthesis protein [Marinomonas profundi]NLQ18980.1 lipopolysaccharide biosynthesis protein [Marinomonas profundi]UDV04188.1 lipopolysaccharide biosynthesis protein [Marinomonas profundi]